MRDNRIQELISIRSNPSETDRMLIFLEQIAMGIQQQAHNFEKFQ